MINSGLLLVVISFVVVGICTTTVTAQAANCTCSNTTACAPLTSPKPSKELFVYTPDGKGFESYNWTKITTVVTYSMPIPELVCYAHSRGVRVVFAGGTDFTVAADPTQRKAWANRMATVVRENFLDGVNFDFENSFKDPLKSNLVTALYFDLVDAVRKDNPNAQTSACIATFEWWQPNEPATWLPYDFTALLDKSDFLMAMLYDQSSFAHVGPNSYYVSINATTFWLQRLSNMRPDQIVFGFPWYGYDYRCVNGSWNSDRTWCKPMPTGSEQIDYDAIVSVYEQRSNPHSKFKNITEISRNLNLGGDGTFATFSFEKPEDVEAPVHIIVFDDAETLTPKYNASMIKYGAKGLSMWNAQALETSTSDPHLVKKRREMWEAINAFF